MYFKRYEPSSCRQLLVLLFAIPTGLSIYVASTHGPFVGTFTLVQGSYYLLLLIYPMVYRTSPFHPLAKYPGPFPAKVSKLWTAYVVSRGKAHLYFNMLHERYGDIVRVGESLVCMARLYQCLMCFDIYKVLTSSQFETPRLYMNSWVQTGSRKVHVGQP